MDTVRKDTIFYAFSVYKEVADKTRGWITHLIAFKSSF